MYQHATMDRATRLELKKLLVLVVIISATGIVLQISMVNNIMDARYSRILPHITNQLRRENGQIVGRRVLRTHTTYSGNNSFVIMLTNLSLQSNQTLDDILLKNKSLTSKEWLYLMETRQMIRTDRTKRICAQLNLSKFTAEEMLERKGLRATFYSNDPYKITFSVVKKAASNNFENLFKELGGLTRLFMLPDDMCKPRLESYTKVLFIRHPLSRVLSAYIDKFVLHHIDHFIGIGRNIIYSHRKNVSKQERIAAAKKATDVKFKEFIEYIAGDPKHRKNTHWNNYWKHNRVCEIQYDFIGKLETIRDDVKYMLYKLKVDNLTQLDIPRAYMTYHGDRDKLRSYYQDISKGLLRQFFSVYKTDFELFGYSMDLLGHSIWS